MKWISTLLLKVVAGCLAMTFSTVLFAQSDSSQTSSLLNLTLNAPAANSIFIPTQFNSNFSTKKNEFGFLLGKTKKLGSKGRMIQFGGITQTDFPFASLPDLTWHICPSCIAGNGSASISLEVNADDPSLLMSKEFIKDHELINGGKMHMKDANARTTQPWQFSESLAFNIRIPG